MNNIFVYLVVAFNVWMLVDAVRRRAKFFWFLILLFVPFGGLIYFFVVKMSDYPFGQFSRSTRERFVGEPSAALGHDDGPPSISEVGLEQADVLEEAGRHDQALALFEAVLAQDQDNLRALHGKARCHLGRGEAEQAVEALERVMDLDKDFRGFGAALDYAEALHQAHRNQDAVDLLRGLVSVSPRLNHSLALAHYLGKSGAVTEARGVLRSALTRYESASTSEKQRSERWAAKAAEMLEELSGGAGGHSLN